MHGSSTTFKKKQNTHDHAGALTSASWYMEVPSANAAFDAFVCGFTATQANVHKKT
jgi:hypothetical protein